MGKKKTKKVRKPSAPTSSKPSEDGSTVKKTVESTEPASSTTTKVSAASSTTSSTSECTYCAKPGARMLCTRCRSPYCTRECQKNDWGKHRPICSAKVKQSKEAEERMAMSRKAQAMKEAAKAFGGTTIRLDSDGNIIDGSPEEAQYTFTGFPENAISQVLDNMKEHVGDELASTKTELEKWKRQVNELNKSLKETRVNLQTTTNVKTSLEQKFQKEKEKNSKTVSVLEKQVQDYKKKLSSTESKSKNTRNTLENRIKALEEENSKLKRDLNESIHELQLSKERERKQSETMSELIASNSKVLDREASSISTYQNQIQDLNKKLVKAHEKQSENDDEMSKKYEHLSREFVTLQQELREKNSNYENLLTLFRNLQQANSEQQEQLHQQRMELAQQQVKGNFLPHFDSAPQEQWNKLDSMNAGSGLFQFGTDLTKPLGAGSWNEQRQPSSGLSLPTFSDDSNQWGGGIGSLNTGSNGMDPLGSAPVHAGSAMMGSSPGLPHLEAISPLSSSQPGGFGDIHLGSLDSQVTSNNLHPTTEQQPPPEVVSEEVSETTLGSPTLEADEVQEHEAVQEGQVAEEEEDESLCIICMHRIPMVMMLPCCHKLCSACAVEWRDRDRTCPTCRRTVLEFCGEINEVFADEEETEGAQGEASAAVESAAVVHSPAAEESFQQVVNRKQRRAPGHVETAATPPLSAAAIAASLPPGGKMSVPYIPLPPSGVPYEGHPKWKTQICRHYEAKRCQNSRRTCPFAHGKQDLRQVTDQQRLPLPGSKHYAFHMQKLEELAEANATPTAPPTATTVNDNESESTVSSRPHLTEGSHPLWKTQLCKHFLAGRCAKNITECPFAHGNADLRVLKPKHPKPDLVRSSSDAPRSEPGAPRLTRHSSTGGHAHQSAASAKVPSGKTNGTNSEHQADHPSNHPLWKTQLCRHYQSNSCFRKASECQFAHGESDLKVLPNATPPSLTLGDVINSSGQ